MIVRYFKEALGMDGVVGWNWYGKCWIPAIVKRRDTYLLRLEAKWLCEIL